MAINIKNDETERLAREVAARTGETLTETVRNALLERLQRLDASAHQDVERLWSDLESIRRELGPYAAGTTTDDLYDPATGLPA